MKKPKRHRPPPENPRNFREAALYIAARIESEYPSGRHAWEVAKKALKKMYGKWDLKEPLTPHVRAWVAQRWGVRLPGEHLHYLKGINEKEPFKPCVGMAILHIPRVPDDQLADAYEQCALNRQKLELHVANLEQQLAASKAEVERLQAIIKARLAKAARDGGKR